MMGVINRQLGFESERWKQRIPKDSMYWQIHDWAAEYLDESFFAPLFSDTGRPSICPIHTFLGVIIQLALGLSDVGLEEASRFDLRVQLAIHAPHDFEGIDAVTLCRHRRMFFEHRIAMDIFERVFQTIADAGLLGDEKRAIIDSFMICGAAGPQDTYTLIRSATVKTLFIADCHEIVIDRSTFRHPDYAKPGKPDINWTDADEKANLLTDLVFDALSVIEQIEARKSIPEELQDMVKLLKTIATQDVRIEDGRAVLVRGTAKNRVISLNDPEMRHGRKTSSKKNNGYKANVVVVGENGGVISDIDVVPANVADGEPLGDILDDLDEKDRRPEVLLGDTAYGSFETKEEQADKGTRIEAKVAPTPQFNDRFTKDDFFIDLDNQTITCPAGCTVTIPPQFLENHKGGTVTFAAKTCNECPLHDQCTAGKGGRTIRVHPYERERQAEKAYQQTEAFKDLYSYRAHVERIIAHLKQRGAGVARYFGLAKTTQQMWFHAMTHNIRFLMKNKPKGGICLAA